MKKIDYLSPRMEIFRVETGRIVMTSVDPERDDYGTGDDFTAPGEDIFD